jgi:hypothetical protein
MSADSSLRRVVLLGADFAPSNLPPALRLRFFATHLREFGWQPTVLTTDPARYDWPVDHENERLVPSGVEVIRTPALPISLTRRLGIGDVGIRSMWHHWRVLRSLCARGEIDLLFIALPPYVPAVLGRLARDRFGIPYVIDYIDPWVNDYYRTVPVPERPGGRKWAWWNSVGRVLEPYALRRVSHLTTVSPGYLTHVLSRYPWLSPSDVTGIPYGGEPADVEYLLCHPHPNPVFDRNDGYIHLSHVGRGGVDMLPVLRVLFAAVRQGLIHNPDLFARLRLHFVGTSYDPRPDAPHQILPLAREMGLESVIDERPARVSYLDALQILMDSHALVAVGSELPYYTASKIFPFILARRPLLAIFHAGSTVVDIVRETGAGSVVAFTGPEDLESRVSEVVWVLETLIAVRPDQRPATRWGAFETYTTRAMSAHLAAVFDCVFERDGRER